MGSKPIRNMYNLPIKKKTKSLHSYILFCPEISYSFYLSLSLCLSLSMHVMIYISVSHGKEYF